MSSTTEATTSATAGIESITLNTDRILRLIMISCAVLIVGIISFTYFFVSNDPSVPGTRIIPTYATYLATLTLLGSLAYYAYRQKWLRISSMSSSSKNSLALFYFLAIFCAGVGILYQQRVKAAAARAAEEANFTFKRYVPTSMTQASTARNKLLLAVVCFVLFLIGLYIWNPAHFMSTHFGAPIIFISVFICFVLVLLIYGYNHFFSNPQDYSTFNNSLSNGLMRGVYVLGTLAILGAMLYWLFDTVGAFNQNASTGNVVLSYLLTSLLVIGILTLLYKYAGAGAAFLPKNPYMRFLTAIVMYIPCLLYSLVQTIIQGLFATSRIDVFFLVLILVLFLLYKGAEWGISSAVKKYTTQGGGVVAEDGKPIYTNVKTYSASLYNLFQGGDVTVASTAANTDTAAATTADVEPGEVGSGEFDYQYGLYLQLWLDALPPSTSHAYLVDTDVFSFADVPVIQYNGQENTLKFKVRMKTENGEKQYKTLYEMADVKLQRWLPIVINYSAGTMDIFIDGELHSSSINVVPYIETDMNSIVVGQENGVSGKVKKVLWFESPITMSQMSYL